MAAPLTSDTAIEAALLRPLTSTETTYTPVLIADVSGQLRTKLRSVDDRIAAYAVDPDDATGIDPAAVAGMLARVIKRVLVNPRGLWSTTNGDGPFSYSETYPGSRAGGAAAATLGAVVTDDDIAEILPDITAGFVMPRTIRTRPQLDCR